MPGTKRTRPFRIRDLLLIGLSLIVFASVLRDPQLGAKETAPGDRSFAQVLRMRSQGRFERAQKLLARLATDKRREVRERARSLLDDPVLAIRPLVRAERGEHALEFLILGEGFTLDDDSQAAFFRDSKARVEALLEQEPWREYQAFVGSSAVHLRSAESGVDRPGVSVETILGGAIDEGGTLSLDAALVRGLCARLAVEGRKQLWIVCINSNSTQVNSGGGAYCISRGFFRADGHELGHFSANLRDEYDFDPLKFLPPDGRGGGGEPEEPEEADEVDVPVSNKGPNVILGSDREEVLEQVPWKHWIEAGPESWWNRAEVGLFEGAQYRKRHAWRPQKNCRMREGDAEFCVVCMEAMVLKIYQHVRPVWASVPAASDLVLEDQKSKLVLRVETLRPRTHQLVVSWTQEALGAYPQRETQVESDTLTAPPPAVPLRRVQTHVIDERRLDVAELPRKELSPGWYRIRCEVRDRTPWMLFDSRKRLEQKIEWLVHVK